MGVGPLEVVHFQCPCYWTHGRESESEDEFGIRAAQWLEEKIIQVGVESIAAFIAEPVQGAGGVIIPPTTYWPQVQCILDKYDILFISDEVICAFGRLGYWFGFECFGLRPDLVTFAKGVTNGFIPLGGVMVSEKVADTIIEKGGEFFHGYTYSGHPTACAVGVKTLEIIERTSLLEKVKTDSEIYLAKCFQELCVHPIVGMAQTIGMLGVLQLSPSKKPGTYFLSKAEAGMTCRSHCFANGLIMRAVGDRLIISPPLIMTHAQIDEMMALILLCLDKTHEDMKKKCFV